MEESWSNLGLAVTPAGHVTLSDAGERLPGALVSRIRRAHATGLGELLVYLATEELQTQLTPELSYLRDIGREYLTQACHVPSADGEAFAGVPAPAVEQLALDVMRVPPMVGSEYLSAGVLAEWWQAADSRMIELAQESGGIATVLARRSSAWRTVGRVTFHLAETKRDPERPFAFMATYTQRLSAAGRPQHTPLGRALQEYAGAGNKAALLKLLMPVNEAAQKNAFVARLVQSGAVYSASEWTSREAFEFLSAMPEMEAAGLVVRVPELWKNRRPGHPLVSVSIGNTVKSKLGIESLLDFEVGVTLDGETLSDEELKQMLASSDGLVRIRDQWVEVDREKLQLALDRWGEAQKLAGRNGIPFKDALRILSGFDTDAPDAPAGDEGSSWVGMRAGDWLEETLAKLRSPADAVDAQPPDLQGSLRPYQRVGVEWLRFVTELGLGACLADDMGLGKTIQVIALLLHLKQKHGHATSLLVAPASLLGNWRAELSQFAPTLSARVLHSSEMDDDDMQAMATNPTHALKNTDLLITTYGMLHRSGWLAKHKWRLAILDEAQAIKNASTRQSQAARRLQAGARVALTGTPVENRLGDLWSLFEFLNPGLLGSAKEFDRYAKRLAKTVPPNYRPLRQLTKPYILRRMKTDKTIIADLPGKTEVKAFCSLSKRQAALYQQAIEDFAERVADAEGIGRKGLILAMLLKLKQICNHPSQWMGDGGYAPEESGKFTRLRELCEELAERQQKALIFTQFRGITEPLAAYLSTIFKRPGVVLHGGTEIGSRKKLVDEFQREDGPPFFVLSIKAGGTGLNLTAASTVIHFDRWWNPAVENQATDRAFRIGQKQSVMVHKFVCRGTVEERIDEMIESKLALSRDVLEGGGEALLTEMSNQELIQFLSLDIRKAVVS